MIIVPALLMVAASTAQPVDHPRTFLASVVGVPLRKDEAIISFSFETWGVRFGALCRIPAGWRIKVGSALSPDGILEGQGSQGVSWLREPSPKALHSFVLLTLVGSVQRRDIPVRYGSIPATFKGKVKISTANDERTATLTSRNIRLVPAQRCPS